jgi:hypothetical protein
MMTSLITRIIEEIGIIGLKNGKVLWREVPKRISYKDGQIKSISVLVSVLHAMLFIPLKESFPQPIQVLKTNHSNSSLPFLLSSSLPLNPIINRREESSTDSESSSPTKSFDRHLQRKKG